LIAVSMGVNESSHAISLENAGMAGINPTPAPKPA
jgi:hypothetical protein